MAGYLYAKDIFTHTKKGRTNDGNPYTKVEHTLTLDVSADADGTVSYTIKCTHNVKEIIGWVGCMVSAWIEINGETVLKEGYYGRSDNNGFPWVNNSTISGTLKNKATSSSITIKSKLLPGSDYRAHANWWTDALSVTTLYRTAWHDGTVPTCNIKHNNNNTVTFYGIRGKAGTNNPVNNKHELNYKFYKNGKELSPNYNSLTLGSADGSSYERTVLVPPEATSVNAKALCNFVYNETSTNIKSENVIFYSQPSLPGKPVLDRSKLSRSRLTIKEPWTFTWDAPSNNVKGYHVKLKNNRDSLSIQLDGDTIKAGENQSVNVTSNTIKVAPVGLFSPGDSVYISVEAYNTNGNGKTDWTAYGYTTPPTGQPTGINYNLISGYIDSDGDEVKNAGIVHVKVGDTWKEGQVYIKANDTWHEAETVYTKVNGSWLESQ